MRVRITYLQRELHHLQHARRNVAKRACMKFHAIDVCGTASPCGPALRSARARMNLAAPYNASTLAQPIVPTATQLSKPTSCTILQRQALSIRDQNSKRCHAPIFTRATIALVAVPSWAVYCHKVTSSSVTIASGPKMHTAMRQMVC